MRMSLGVEKSNVADSGPREGKSVKAVVFVRCILFCNWLDASNRTLNLMRKSVVHGENVEIFTASRDSFGDDARVYLFPVRKK